MAARGGRQRIPRPPGARPGEPPPWGHLAPEQRRITLARVREVCEQLPVPVRPSAPPQSRPAAVLVACFTDSGDDADDARMILTKRPDTMPSHRGEIAFPGGKLDPSVDADLRAAALREAHEEVGLDPTTVEVVAELESLATVAGAFVLTPFVGLVPGRPDLTRDPIEVESVFDVTISELLDDATFREERWDVPEAMGPGAGPDRRIHFFELAGETVWGATAHILTAFLARLTDTG